MTADQYKAWLAQQKQEIAEANKLVQKQRKTARRRQGTSRAHDGRHHHSLELPPDPPGRRPRGRRAPRTRAKWVDWVTTTDHKKIGILYMVTTFVFFLLGGVEALLMRTQLAVPNNTFLVPERYNELVTLHGTTMIFLFVVPMMAGFANYFVPLMIGARDMAFPRLNALSYWLLLFGGIVFYASLFFQPPEAGWYSYAPLSTAAFTPSGGQDAWIFLIHITGISSLIGADQLLRDDREHARARHELGPPAAVRLVDPDHAILLILALPDGRRPR